MALRIIGVVAAAAVLLGAQPLPQPVNDSVIVAPGLPRQLSQFGFFEGKGVSAPNRALIRYALRTPLFSDYADKQRFMYIPAGSRAQVKADAHVEFPVGSALIKTFGYGSGADFRPIETRVLLRRASGWEALPYVWNADLTDADLKIAGTRLPISVTKPSGDQAQISYAVPNKNQCKECHANNGNVTPNGPYFPNMDLTFGQLRRFRSQANWPKNPVMNDGPVWNNPATGTLDARARAYLMVNCAHCHNPQGSASNSGLFLNYAAAQDRTATGIYKRPVAAGRGSGGHDFAIAPGKPEASIMIHRMGSTEPGVAMPEVGRSMVHEEGVALIREWISSIPAN